MANSGFLIQSNYGIKGNFEGVVPLKKGGLIHFWRNNDQNSHPWSVPEFISPEECSSPVSLIQSNFGDIGHLEVVAIHRNTLAHYWRIDEPPWTWNGPYYFAEGVKGNPALIQSNHGKKGNFELVVPLEEGGIAHYWRNNDDPSYPWKGPFTFGEGDVEAVSMIQSNFGQKGNLEVVAREGDRLAHYWRIDEPPWTWNGPYYFAEGVMGTPSLIQSNYGKKGNFELVVPLEGDGIAHYWRDNDDPLYPWNGPFPFGEQGFSTVSLIQSNFGEPGNLEVVADSGYQFVHYWRINRQPWTWNGPTKVAVAPVRNSTTYPKWLWTPEETGPDCLVTDSDGTERNWCSNDERTDWMCFSNTNLDSRFYCQVIGRNKKGKPVEQDQWIQNGVKWAWRYSAEMTGDVEIHSKCFISGPCAWFKGRRGHVTIWLRGSLRVISLDPNDPDPYADFYESIRFTFSTQSAVSTISPPRERFGEHIGRDFVIFTPVDDPPILHLVEGKDYIIIIAAIVDCRANRGNTIALGNAGAITSEACNLRSACCIVEK